MQIIEQLPDQYQTNITRAVEILKQGGCTEIFLFGSLASGNFNPQSDIDLAVRGCPSEKFFHLLGQLIFRLDYPVDLIDLDSRDPLARFLKEKGKLQQIG
jgi:predicted nucleotidyltransferase